jgi:hypothetical protein
VEALEDGQDIRQRIRLIQLSVDGTLVEKRYTEVEIREGRRREGLDEDVDNHVGVVEIRIELVALSCFHVKNYLEDTRAVTHSFKMARLARQSYSSLRIWW